MKSINLSVNEFILLSLALSDRYNKVCDELKSELKIHKEKPNKFIFKYKNENNAKLFNEIEDILLLKEKISKKLRKMPDKKKMK